MSVKLERMQMAVSRPCDGCERDIAGMPLIVTAHKRLVLCDDCLGSLHDQLREARFGDRISLWPT